MEFSRLAALFATIPLFSLTGKADTIQDGSVRLAMLPTAPSGFSPSSGAGLQSDIADSTDGFHFSGFFSSTYDSNVRRGQIINSIATSSGSDGDLILGLGGEVSYLTRSPSWTFGGNYHGNYNEYLSNSGFSGYNQGAVMVANYQGGPLSASIGAGVDHTEGNNVDYGSAFVKQNSFTSSIVAKYVIGARTAIEGDFAQRYAEVSGGNFNNTSSYALGSSLLWKYSALTELGPGIRYTYVSGESGQGRSSFGPTVSLNYQLAKKISLNSRVGLDFAEYENGGSSGPSVSASIGATYEASKLWGFDFSFFRDNQADPLVVGAFVQTTSARVGYHRKILRAKLDLGVSYGTDTADGSSRGVQGRDREKFSCDSSVSMPLFSNTCSGKIFVNYQDQTGLGTSWDSVQTGFSLSRSF
jgi:hypothetical protein